jgi:salicylate 5-hydroxylase small subunit
MMDFRSYHDLVDLYASYAAAVDSADWETWPEFFVDDGTYRLQPRENFDRGLPLCLLALESKAMIRDRVYGVKETMYHDPYYQRHVVGTPRVLSVRQEGGLEIFEAEANYLVVRTKRDGVSELFNAGRYRDVIVRTPEGLKFRSRLCVYDTEMIPNSLIYPI